MKLFKLTRQDSWKYEQYISFVIRAESEHRARELAADRVGDWPMDDKSRWMDPTRTTCEELTQDGPEEVVIVNYAGQ